MKIKVYQIVPERDKQNVKFTGLDELEKYQGSKAVNAALYEEVFDGEVDRTTLEGVYELFNTDIPPLYRGHSMSVSDVVKTDDGFYFCDRFGFQKTEFDEALATKPKNLVRVVYVEPGKPAYAAEIENTLRGIQRAVGGYIQTASNEDGTVIVCNEEGKHNSLPSNRRIADGEDILVGNFFIVGEKGTNFRSLTKKETEKYLERFAIPEEIEKGEVEKAADIRFYPE